VDTAGRIPWRKREEKGRERKRKEVWEEERREGKGGGKRQKE